ncbi:MAG: hypothetical protein A2351_07780 [Omnitrophica bacterium RIFOXYB12_FULL_50_7]|nr:MAG: hypothetical protein A2351_07780 [Omnitrophica bacterium RIFOXYB12_FULL_50_7]
MIFVSCARFQSYEVPQKFADEIDAILLQPEQEVNLARDVLLISKYGYQDIYGQDFDVQAYLDQIDQMADRLRPLIAGNKSIKELLSLVNKHIFETYRFSPTEKKIVEEKPETDFFFNKVLDTKKGYCIGLSLIYLTLAERLDLPFYGVFLSKHIFIKYKHGSVSFNIETTLKGRIVPDEYYIKEFSATQDTLKCMTKKETIAGFLYNLGVLYYTLERADEAIWILNKAVKGLPYYADLHGALGSAYSLKKDKKAAIQEYEIAVSLDPKIKLVFFNLGLNYLEIGKEDKALAALERALELDPNNDETLSLVGALYLRKKRYREGLDRIGKALSINPRNRQARSNLELMEKNWAFRSVLKSENIDVNDYYLKYKIEKKQKKGS